MLRALLASALLCSAAGATTAVAPTSDRRQSFNESWRFLKGDAPGAEAPAFSDAAWRDVRLPHDWAIEGPFDAKFNPHTGGLPISGTGWYRKSFTVADSLKGRYLTLEFDGAMSNARVWLNGHELGGRPYGYLGFTVDLTPHLLYGNQPNVLAVRVAPEDRSSRWYPGAGIYRNVWLDITGPIHVDRWGTYATTPQVTDDRASVVVKTEVRNRSTTAASIQIQTTILDAAGKVVVRETTPAAVAPSAVQTASTTLSVARPRRWDVDQPYLYSILTEIQDGARVVDRYTTPLGIRTIAFDKTKGFLLNGRAMKLHGVCLHHDLGALGAAVNRRAIERQLEILKRAGVNAVRTSHNPPAPELLEFCDRLGLVVMDEAFDMWRIPKVPNGYAKYFDEWSERDIRDMVRRDRNHPSIILWSIGNEVPEQGRPDGWQVAKRLVDFVRADDPTRPNTAGFDNWTGAIKNKLAEQVDIPGFNYKPMHYQTILKDHPDWIIFGSETSSGVSSRGVYHLPLENYPKHPSLQITSYDVVAPPWAMPPDVELDYQDKFPNVLGEFVWTGFDYLGEPTPFFGGRGGGGADWPSRSSYFGMVDLAGFPKDRYYLYQSVWTKTPMVHLLPHWNWEGKEGQKIPVMAYSNADEVELFLNGKSLGRKKRFSEPVVIPVGANVSPDQKFTTKYRLLWEVPYAPGALKAVAYRGGKQVAVDEVRTAGAPARITLTPDRKTVAADGDDLAFFTVRIEDKDGNLCPSAANEVRFTVNGSATLRAVDNGNAATEESFQAGHRKAFSGLALLIVQSKRVLGSIQVHATSEGLVAADTRITAHR
jgi:beta-galactosidase